MVKRCICTVVMFLGIVFGNFQKIGWAEESKSNAVSSSPRVSLSVHDTDLAWVLHWMADFAGKNIAVSDEIHQKISVHLKEVPWEEALELVLKTQDLEQQDLGRVIWIDKRKNLLKKQQESLQLQQALEDNQALESTVIFLNYAKVDELASFIKAQGDTFLSSRGHLITEPQQNSLWVEDTQSRVRKIKHTLQSLDRPAKQLLIEARVVSVERAVGEELGMKFGLHHPGAHVSGSLASATQLARREALSTDMRQRLNANLAQKLDNVAESGHVGMALARLGAGFLLDIELSALESQGKGQVISSPRLMTVDQQPAVIEAGEEIPYQEATAGGATNVAFKKAVLSLQVTPHITPNDKIWLKLVVNQDKRSGKPEVLGVPAIDTRHIETQVLVENGETVVLGGIYEKMKKTSRKKIPGLGSLPVLGYLFGNSSQEDQQVELLVFVTPRLLK